MRIHLVRASQRLSYYITICKTRESHTKQDLLKNPSLGETCVMPHLVVIIQNEIIYLNYKIIFYLGL